MYEWESDFAPHILERGWKYARNGNVQNIIKDGDTISAIVAGSEYYKVEIEFDGHFILDAYCSCPYAADGNNCKHMAAVMYMVGQNGSEKIDETEEGEEVQPSLKSLIEAAERKKLEQILLELAASDPEADNHIRLRLSGGREQAEINALKRNVDSIFIDNSDRSGFINYHNFTFRSYDIEDFRAYRGLCTKEEWAKERAALIGAQENTDWKCDLYVEEKMFTELFELIAKQENQRGYFDKYGFLLADDYSEYILGVYEAYVSRVAGRARNRANYDELTRNLKRMQRYEGGRELVSRLCTEWIRSFPTRKVMVEELRKFV